MTTTLHVAVLSISVVAFSAATATELNEHRPVYSPDGSQLIFMSKSDQTSGDWELFVMDADRKQSRRLTEHKGWDGYAVWSPNASSIIFDRSLTGGQDDKTPFRHELKTGEERQLGSFDGWLSVNDWSSDDKLLAFWEKDGQRDLYLLDLDGNIIRQLTDTRAISEHDAHFSPDGRMVAFASQSVIDDGKFALEVIDTVDGSRRLLHSSIGRVYGVDWAPDGNSIAYTDAPDGDDDDADIFVIDIATKSISRLTDDPSWDHMPEWRRDGQALLFTSYRSGEERIYAINISAGAVHPLCDIDTGCAMAQQIFTDPRDQQAYGVVEIAGQRWMTENLRFAAQNSACYENNPKNCESSGRLYSWEVALQVCPDDWHLATEYEWQNLELALGVPFAELQADKERGEPAGEKLKMSSQFGLKFPYAGYGDPDGNYEARGETAAIWTSTEADFNHAWHRDIDVQRTGIYRSRVYKPWLLSVRCVANRREDR